MYRIKQVQIIHNNFKDIKYYPQKRFLLLFWKGIPNYANEEYAGGKWTRSVVEAKRVIKDYELDLATRSKSIKYIKV